MKIQSQTSPERSRLAALIEPMTVAMLTTSDDNGALASRPMAPLELDAKGALWFFTDLCSAKVDQLSVVNLSFSDASRACYVSMSGHGEVHTDRAQIERLWTPFAKPWFPEGPKSTNLALLKIVPHSAEIWDAPNSKMLRLFALAASVVAGKRIGLGTHETLGALTKSLPGRASL